MALAGHDHFIRHDRVTAAVVCADVTRQTLGKRWSELGAAVPEACRPAWTPAGPGSPPGRRRCRPSRRPDPGARRVAPGGAGTGEVRRTAVEPFENLETCPAEAGVPTRSLSQVMGVHKRT